MDWKKINLRRIATVLSVLYLLALTILAIYAAHSIHVYSLPISNTLSTFTLLLPPIAGIILETSSALARSISTRSSSPSSNNNNTTSQSTRRAPTTSIPPVLLPSTLSIVVLLIYATATATLSGTHTAPASRTLDCALRLRWQDLFRARDKESISRIQDAFNCCGLASTRDMPFPFPDGRHGVDSCVERYEERVGTSCLGAWRGEERVVGGVMVGVAVGVVVWMIVIVATPAVHPSAVRNVLHLPAPGSEDEDTERQANGSPSVSRAIEYVRYRDEPDGDAPESRQEEDDTSVHREITTLNNQSNLASMVEGGRSHPSRLTEDTNRWREGASA